MLRLFKMLLYEAQVQCHVDHKDATTHSDWLLPEGHGPPKGLLRDTEPFSWCDYACTILPSVDPYRQPACASQQSMASQAPGRGDPALQLASCWAAVR